MGRPRRTALAVAACAALLAPGAIGIAACGDDGPSYTDEEIVDKLNLEENLDGSAYTIDGDPFCEISKQLLNDAGEIEEAQESAKIDLIVTSREGNVGIQGVETLASPCPEIARKKLSRLDPRSD